MKQFLIESPGIFRIEEVTEQLLQPEEVRVKVHRISLCGSDLHLFHGTYGGPAQYPLTFGHEWSGEVVETGTSVTGVSVGDIVTGDCSKYCGTCENCRIDRNLCRTIEKFGITDEGASYETIVRHQRYLYRVDRKISYAAAALAEPLAVGAQLLKRISSLVPDLKEKRILLIGLGGIGLGALLQLIHTYGCRHIFAGDISEYRTNLAREFGAQIVDLTREAAPDSGTYGSLYEPGGYDIIIDATGSPKVFQLLFHLAAPFGVIGCLGMIPKVEIPQKLIVLKALTVTGTIGGTGSFPDVLKLIADHQEEVQQLVTDTVCIENSKSLNEAFERATQGIHTLKVQLMIP